jgi:urease accessory protein
VIEIIARAVPGATATRTLELPFEARQRSRLRVNLADGEEAGLHLERGTVLRGGDLLCTACGQVVQVVASTETVSVAETPDTRLLTRAAYHLGNRHIPVEVRDGALLYLHDHVLDDMLRGLGLRLRVDAQPFEPEAGAYGRGTHDHAHGHAHGHHHGHEQAHGHVAAVVLPSASGRGA